MGYNPLTGEDYSQDEARTFWAGSMDRARYEGPKWTLQGSGPGHFYWRFWDFKNWFARVTIEADGFHWSKHDDYTGDTLLSGVTTSLYEAYQSAAQGKEIRRIP